MRLGWLMIGLGFGLGLAMSAGAAGSVGDDPVDRWELAEHGLIDGVARVLFVERDRTPGRPAFKIETRFPVPPVMAAATLMDGMLTDDDLPDGQSRQILEHDAQEALVYTFIDLPFMLSDRELALRIVHSEDPESGVHRIDWAEANDALPAQEGSVVRLSGAMGYWEFRPDGEGGTQAVHMTQTELGGSIPDAIGYRLMKSQALDSVERLRGRLRERSRTRLAGSPTIVEPVRE